MNAWRSTLVRVIAWCTLGLMAGANAPGADKPSGNGRQQPAGRRDARKPGDEAQEEEYVPRKGSPPGRRTDGGTRSPEEGKLPRIILLAPRDTAGYTTQEQPVLFWALPSPADGPVLVTIYDTRRKAEPLLRLTLEGKQAAGIHRLDLSKLPEAKGCKLEPGVRYDWAVRVPVRNQADQNNVTAVCPIFRLDLADVPPSLAVAKDSPERANALSAAGIWFDYLAALDDLIRADPSDSQWVRRRDRLLQKEMLMQDDGTLGVPAEALSGRRGPGVRRVGR